MLARLLTCSILIIDTLNSISNVNNMHSASFSQLENFLHTNCCNEYHVRLRCYTLTIDLSQVIMKQLSQQFEPNAVRVTLDWTTDEGFLYSYYFSTVPQIEHTFDGSTTVELTVPYNTLYNVSVEATHLCSLIVTSFIELYYSEYYTVDRVNDIMLMNVL